MVGYVRARLISGFLDYLREWSTLPAPRTRLHLILPTATIEQRYPQRCRSLIVRTMSATAMVSQSKLNCAHAQSLESLS